MHPPHDIPPPLGFTPGIMRSWNSENTSGLEGQVNGTNILAAVTCTCYMYSSWILLFDNCRAVPHHLGEPASSLRGCSAAANQPPGKPLLQPPARQKPGASLEQCRLHRKQWMDETAGQTADGLTRRRYSVRCAVSRRRQCWGCRWGIWTIWKLVYAKQLFNIGWCLEDIKHVGCCKVSIKRLCQWTAQLDITLGEQKSGM